jgi:hypothetical protein
MKRPKIKYKPIATNGIPKRGNIGSVGADANAAISQKMANPPHNKLKGIRKALDKEKFSPYSTYRDQIQENQ